MACVLGCRLHRSSAVLFWLPLLTVVPLFYLHGPSLQRGGQVAVLAVMAAAATTAVLTGGPGGRPVTARAALVVLAACVVVAATQGSGWSTPWNLLAITAPAVLRGWWLAATLAFATIGSMLAGWWVSGIGDTFWIGAAGVLLSGLATTSFLRMLETIEELRRTREELARLAVAQERERFSRDLHDLLGHTLSVIVVKAQAVRRLAAADAAAAARHAGDIEEVGRAALEQVRAAVDDLRAPRLAEELEGAGRALDAAGIRAQVDGYDGSLPAEADAALAWVVREGVTNVLRHSGAEHCRVEVAPDGADLRLAVVDDGVGGPIVREGRRGGLDGLHGRLTAVGGRLVAEPGDQGFRLVATVPVGGR